MARAATLSKDERNDLAARIEVALRASTGVHGVYRSGSLISNLLRAGVAALGGQNGGDPVVSVVSGRRGVAVEASIGVDVGSSSGTTLRVARDAVEAVLREGDLDRESITLIVAYVSPRVAATPGAEDR